MPLDKIITLLKAVDKDFFDGFLNQGQICMNTVKWFRDYEAKSASIGDKFEGIEMACGKGFTVRVGAPIKSYSSQQDLRNKLNSVNWKELSKEGIDLRYYHEDNNANILSFYAITSQNLLDGKLVPKKFIDEFSNHKFVFLLEPDTFITRMSEEIKKMGKTLECGLVQYYRLDENMKKNLTYFNKPDKYSYQNEFRIVVEDNNATKRIFNLGSLKEICVEIDINKKYSLKLIDNYRFSINSID